VGIAFAFFTGFAALVVLVIVLLFDVIAFKQIKCSSVAATGDVVSGGNLNGNQLRFNGGANIQTDSAGKLEFNSSPGFQFNEAVTVSGGVLYADQLWFTTGANIQPDSATGVLHFNNNQGFVFGGSKVDIYSDLHVMESTDGTTTTGGGIVADQGILAGQTIRGLNVVASKNVVALNAIIGNTNKDGYVYANNSTAAAGTYLPGNLSAAIAAGYSVSGVTN